MIESYSGHLLLRLLFQVTMRKIAFQRMLNFCLLVGYILIFDVLCVPVSITCRWAAIDVPSGLQWPARARHVSIYAHTCFVNSHFDVLAVRCYLRLVPVLFLITIFSSSAAVIATTCTIKLYMLSRTCLCLPPILCSAMHSCYAMLTHLCVRLLLIAIAHYDTVHRGSNSAANAALLMRIETGAGAVVGRSWDKRLHAGPYIFIH